ncbi:hypothetical protein HDU89_008578 [Geranomyces variabilis]|nr:hypothetical protein HDU89_008578 [Geranomyces variabilis]
MRKTLLYAVLTTSIATLAVAAPSPGSEIKAIQRTFVSAAPGQTPNVQQNENATPTPTPSPINASSGSTPLPSSSPGPPEPQFGVPQEILGGMQRTDFDFADGLAIDLFSPKPRTLIVTQNKSPSAPGTLVTGAPGGPWLAVLPYSYVLKLNELDVTDLVAKVELPYDPVALAKMGLTEDNTFVGVFSPTTGGWVIDETQRNVHRTENKTRIINMNSYDGEYQLLARNTTDTADIFLQYGQGASRELQVIRGGALQEGVWVDGLKLSARVDGTGTVRVNADFGAIKAPLPAGFRPVTTFSYVVNSSDPTVKASVDINIPFKPTFVASQQIDPTTLRVARLDPGTKSFVVDATGQKLDTERKFAVLEKQPSLDGEWLLVVGTSGTTVGSSGAVGQTSNGGATVESSGTAGQTSNGGATVESSGVYGTSDNGGAKVESKGMDGASSTGAEVISGTFHLSPRNVPDVVAGLAAVTVMFLMA